MRKALPAAAVGPAGVVAIALSTDRVFATGGFGFSGGQRAGRVAKVANSNGLPDAKFAPQMGFDKTVTALAVQDGDLWVGGNAMVIRDGRWIFGGTFSTCNGVMARGAAVFDPTASTCVDAAGMPGGAAVTAIANGLEDADGAVTVFAGSFGQPSCAGNPYVNFFRATQIGGASCGSADDSGGNFTVGSAIGTMAILPNVVFFGGPNPFGIKGPVGSTDVVSPLFGVSANAGCARLHEAAAHGRPGRFYRQAPRDGPRGRGRLCLGGGITACLLFCSQP